jgi:murein biosynthesis integral membrane protein MurJ
MPQSSEPLSITKTRTMTAPLKSVHGRIFQALLSISSAALLIRAFGMLNQIVVTGSFGAGAAMDSYFVAYALPYLMGQLGSGAIEASVIPVYARVRLQGREQASRLFSTVLNLLFLGTALLTLIMLALRQPLIHLTAPALDPLRAALAESLAPIIFPALLLMLVISFLECILNAEGQFGWPAYAGLLVPLATAILVLALGRSEGVVMLCIGTLVGLCLQFCVVIIRVRRAGIVYRPRIDLRNPEIGAILIAAWPVLVGALISQASPLVDQVFASFLTAGSISALNYSLKLIGVPVGVIFVSVGRAALPYLSRQASTNDMKAFKKTLRLYLWAVGMSTILLTVFMLVLAHPLVQILFQRGAFTAEDTNRTASTLMGFVVGLVPMALGFILARAFSALGRTRVLMGVTIFSVGANAILDYIFVRLWQSFGIALATSAVYFCTLFILLFMLRRLIGKLRFLTPPPEMLQAIQKESLSLYYLRLVSWRQLIVRVGIMLAVFTAGVVAISRNSLFTLRATFGLLVILTFLRYPYVLLVAWVTINAFVGSTVQIFNGNNLDTVLSIPLLLLLGCMPMKQTFKSMPALALLFIFALWVFAGITVSAIGLQPFLTDWAIMLDYVAIGALTINILTTRKRLLRLIDAMLIPTTFISLYGIYGYLTRHNGTQDSTSSLFRIFSIYSAAPPLALFLSLMIPPAIFRAFTLQGFKRLGVAALVFIFLMTLGLTFTRGAIICIPLSIIIMVLFLPPGKMRIGLLGGILALAVGIVGMAKVGNVPILSRFFNQDLFTLNGRTYLWQALLDHFDPTQLLGHGLGASTLLLNNLQVGYGGVIATSASNLFLSVLYDHGIIGLILFSLVFIALAVSLIAGIRKTTGEQRTLLVMALVVFVNLVLQSLDVNDFWAQAVGIYFWIIMALPFALCWSKPKQPSGIDQEVLHGEMESQMETVGQAKQGQVSRV